MSSRRRRRPPKPPPPFHIEPLPWQLPKSLREDPEALRRVTEIMSGPSYRLAVEDPDFLWSYEARPLRLMADYLKAELQLQKHGVRNTIVVFGSTRLEEPGAARRRLEELREALAKDPSNPELQRKVKIAERRYAKSKFYQTARQFSRIVSNYGHGPLDCRLVITTGGGPGIMEAANRGAFDVGAKSVGFNIQLPHEQYPNPYISKELCFQFHYFAIRKMHFLLRAKALVIFPGGFGTLDELFETLTLIQTRKIHPVPVILVGEEYWSKVIDFEFLVEEGTIDPEDLDLFGYAETAEEIWEEILSWYREKREPLINGDLSTIPK